MKSNHLAHDQPWIRFLCFRLSLAFPIHDTRFEEILVQNEDERHEVQLVR